jgi:hypothetical protein
MSDFARVAMIRLGFGAEFIPIYRAHGRAEVIALCHCNEAELTKSARKGVELDGLPEFTLQTNPKVSEFAQ